MKQLCGRSERRAHVRVKLPFHAVVNGADCQLVDISLGGFRICDADHQIDDVEEVLLRMRLEVLTIDLKVTARCVGHDPVKRESGFEFVNLSPEQAYLFDALCAAAADENGAWERGDEFLKYAARRADRAVKSHYSLAPLCI